MTDPVKVEQVDRGSFQERVQPWLMECFGANIASDRDERNHRFLEEALELVQATGCTASEAHQLVDYVYGRPQGEINQEVGGVMVTLAALCLASELDMHEAGETELARIWTKVDKIRAKHAAKPKHSPLPIADQGRQAAMTQPTPADIEAVIEKSRSAKANGDPAKYTSGLSVADAHFLADTIEHLQAELKTACNEVSKWSRKAGFAEGKLEISEAASIVEGWKERAERAEAKLARLTSPTDGSTAIGSTPPMLSERLHSAAVGHSPGSAASDGVDTSPAGDDVERVKAALGRSGLVDPNWVDADNVAREVIAALTPRNDVVEALREADGVLRSIPAPHNHPLWVRMCSAMQKAETVLASISPKHEGGE